MYFSFHFQFTLISKPYKMSDRHFRDSFGFYPTSKGDESEWDAYNRIRDRVQAWVKHNGVHSGNIRGRFHDLFVFTWQEASALYGYARSNPGLERLLPSLEASQGYVMTVTLAVISEDSKKHRLAALQKNRAQQDHHQQKPAPKRQRKD